MHSAPSSEQSSSDHQETLLEFPARFPIKIMGENSEAFRHSIIDLAESLPKHQLVSLSERLSKDGRYLAFTLTAIFYDKPSIDAIYQQLTNNSHVKMAL